MDTRICVIGTGYVGIATVVGLATLGHRVIGFDTSLERVQRLKRGTAPYRERGLDEMLQEHLRAGSIAFTESLETAVEGCEVIVIAVGTPSREDGSADLSSLEMAFQQLAALKLSLSPVIVIRSTVPPGTSDRIAREVEDWAEVIVAPEFLREGNAVADFLSPDRIIIGARTPSASLPYVRLYEALHRPVVFTSRSNAELIKMCSNAFLALKISFANEVANLCAALGGLADDVLRGVGYDHRIGPDFLKPGIGFGGPCFEKDVKSIRHVAALAGIDSQLFSATLRTNDAQPNRVIKQLEKELGGLADARIGIWGLAFKAGTDDIRDSLAVRIVSRLSAEGAKTAVYDPAVRVAPLPAGSRLVTTALEAANADALLVLTDWPEFAKVDVAEVALRLRRRIIVDGRNVLDGERYAAAGVRYHGVGRPSERGYELNAVQTASV